MRHRVFVDTNLIIEAYRTGLWNSLTARHSIETVQKCHEESHTGCQNRDPETWIDDREFVASLGCPPHVVDDRMRAVVLACSHSGALDPGELDVWAAALNDPGVWIVSGPDGASMIFGIANGYGERLLSMEDLVANRKEFQRRNVNRQYSRKWLDEVRQKSFERFGHIPSAR
jgi:hypothetical protein